MSGRAALALVLALPLAACGTATQAHQRPDAVVVVRDMKFIPAQVSVPVGGTVQWRFDDGGILHHVHADDGRFQSPAVGAGTYVHTFDRPGTYTYRCLIHTYMTGAVAVAGF